MKYHKATHLWAWLVRVVTSVLPDCAPTMRLRGGLYGLLMQQRGRDFQVASNVQLNGLEKISVGDHVYLAPGVVVLASSSITLGDEVMIAHHSVVTDGNHTPIRGSYRYGPRVNAAVTIGRGTWIGANCTVLPGVRIGEGVLVGANSAVTKDVSDGAIVGGVPARIIRGTQRDVATVAMEQRATESGSKATD